MISISRDADNPGGYLLRAECTLSRPLDELFPFFADAMNLEQITPPWVQFRVVTPPPIEMFAGQTIDYRLKIHSVPVRWRTEISQWDPPHSFSDTQLHGPYTYWRHLHRFEQVQQGTKCLDIVHYKVPGGPLVHQFLVKRDVLAIFEYRRKVMFELFSSPPPAQSAQPTPVATVASDPEKRELG